jgi:hypothetical protein
MEENDQHDQSLDEFRSQWRNELMRRKGQNDGDEDEESSESMATRLFLSAVELERELRLV